MSDPATVMVQMGSGGPLALNSVVLLLMAVAVLACFGRPAGLLRWIHPGPMLQMSYGWQALPHQILRATSPAAARQGLVPAEQAK